eukprot:COSAG01_NODE_7545_length_3157_cov_5.849902_3_plen_102_part_00
MDRKVKQMELPIGETRDEWMESKKETMTQEIIERCMDGHDPKKALIHYILDAYDFGEDTGTNSSVLDSHIDDLQRKETEQAMKYPNPLLVGESDQSKVATE